MKAALLKLLCQVLAPLVAPVARGFWRALEVEAVKIAKKKAAALAAAAVGLITGGVALLRSGSSPAGGGGSVGGGGLPRQYTADDVQALAQILTAEFGGLLNRQDRQEEAFAVAWVAINRWRVDAGRETGLRSVGTGRFRGWGSAQYTRDFRNAPNTRVFGQALRLAEAALSQAQAGGAGPSGRLVTAVDDRGFPTQFGEVVPFGLRTQFVHHITQRNLGRLMPTWNIPRGMIRRVDGKAGAAVLPPIVITQGTFS